MPATNMAEEVVRLRRFSLLQAFVRAGRAILARLVPERTGKTTGTIQTARTSHRHRNGRGADAARPRRVVLSYDKRGWDQDQRVTRKHPPPIAV
jgi:hypothetical protein